MHNSHALMNVMFFLQGSSILPVSSVREMVYEQWLHANLREVVSRPCIPTSVTDQQATQICGRFIVQVIIVVLVIL